MQKLTLKLAVAATIAMLAVLLTPMAVGADVSAVFGAQSLDSVGDNIYPWREPADVGIKGISLAASGPYAMWDGTYSYYSEVSFLLPVSSTATTVLLNIEVKDQASTPSGVDTTGYCADQGEIATKDIWLPNCQATSGAVTHILNNYYPVTDEPTTGGGETMGTSDKVAAVQSAIWYFTDGAVLRNGLNTSPRVYAATQAIIADASANAGGTPDPSDLDLMPKTERNDLNDSTTHTVVARLTDAWGNGVSGQNVHFEVKRSNVLVEDETILTDALGNATLTYTFTGVLSSDIVTDTIYAWANYRQESGLRFCMEDTQDYVIAEPVEIPLEDMVYKEWVECRDYAAAQVDWSVDCVENKTTFTYLVSGDDESGPSMQTFAVALCNLVDTGHNVTQVRVADAGDCANPSPTGWVPEYYLVHAPSSPSNPMPGQWCVEIPANIGQDECKYFEITIEGLWTVDTVPWAGVVSAICDASGSVQGPSCTPYQKPVCDIVAPSYVCDGATGNTASVSTAAITYTWVITGGTITSGQGTSSIIWDATSGAPGIELALTVGDINGCESTCYKLITPMALPEVVVGDKEVCVGETVTLTAVMLDLGDCDENEITYMWEYQDLGGQWHVISGATGATYSYQTTVAGSFNYRVTACCGECCDMDGATVTVHPYPEITLVGDEVCVGEPVTLTVVINDAGDCDEEELIYQWYAIASDGQTRILLQGETGATYSPDTSVPGTTTYVVEVCCADCCVEAQADVIVHPYPVVTMEPIEVCEDEPGTLVANISDYGDCDAASIDIAWYVKNVSGNWVLIPGETGETLSPDTSVVGVWEYKVVVCCGACCDEAEATVTVLPYPEVLLIGDEVCVGTPVTLTANVTDPGDCDPNELTYQWYMVEGQTRTLLQGEIGATYSPDTSVPGTTTYLVVVCCDECCDEAQADVIVHPYPVVTMEPIEVCEDEPGTLVANISDYGDCEPGGVDIAWYKKDVAGAWQLIAGETGETLVVDTSAEGVYEYMVIVCCEACCDEAEATVTVLPYPVVVLIGDEICLGERATLVANVTDSGDCETNEIVFTWYQWNTGTAAWDLIPGESGATLSVTPTAAGSYNYKVVACCDECCDEDEAIVIVDPLPEFTLEGDEVCIGGTATVTSDITSYGDCEDYQVTIAWYAWNEVTQQWDLLPNETGESLSVTPAAEGSYQFKMVLCCEECCAEDEATVTVYGEPPCWIEGDLEPCAGDVVTFTAAPGAASYAWSVDGVLRAITAVPTWDWTAVVGEHTISVVITDTQNCMSECETDVDVKQPRLIIQKFWDHDEDGVRDTNDEYLGGFEFTVYDENDQVVFTGVTDDDKGQISVELDCGTYRIVESDKDGWIHTTPAEVTISIDLSQDQWLVEFGNTQPFAQPVRILGVKFWDLDHDSRFDATEPLLAGFRILVEREDGTLYAERTSSDVEAWTVDMDETGIFTVREEVLSGWVQTYPTPNGGEYRFEVYEVSAGVLAWRLLSAEPADWDNSFDFGNVRPMGFKWHDLNGDRDMDPGEPFLGNWRIVIKDMAFNIVHDTTTISDPTSSYYGYWFLTHPLPEGEYYVVEDAPPGWTQTYPTDGWKIHLYEDGSYDVLSAPQRWMDGLSFGNATLGNPSCVVCTDRAVFQSDRDDSNYDIYTQAMDGSNVLRLTTDMGVDISPSWDFSGQSIVWSTNRDGDFEIYIMDKEGVIKTNVTNMPGVDDIQPNMGCEWIAFRTDRDGNWEIYKVKPEDPTVQIRLTNNDAVDTAPYWSPDESMIAFQSDRDGNQEIYVMSAQGEDYSLRRITDNDAVDRNPAWLITTEEAVALYQDKTAEWEPWIVFESDRNESGQFDLFKYNLNTGELIELTDDAADDTDAAGIPYCDLVVFQSSRNGSLVDLWKMDHKGENETLITLNDNGPIFWMDAVDYIGLWFGYIPEPEVFRSVVPIVFQ